MEYSDKTKKYINKVRVCNALYIVGFICSLLFNGLTILHIAGAAIALITFLLMQFKFVSPIYAAVISIIIAIIPFLNEVNTVTGLVSVMLIIDSFILIINILQDKKSTK